MAMKALYIYNPHSAPELDLIQRAQNEMGSYIEAISVDNLPELMRRFVRATPALIPVNDDLQGENLTSEGVDGQLLATAMLYKRLEEEEASIHNAQSARLDNMINAERTKAIDDYTLELIDGGLI
jgi:hypothetical protein